MSICIQSKSLFFEVNEVKATCIYDSTKIAILPFVKTKRKEDKKTTNADLTIIELNKIDSILAKTLEEHNSRFGKSIDLKNYYRQYVATINGKGEKKVWINCFCEKYDDWKSKILHVCDGGDYYFTSSINLTSWELEYLTFGGR